MNKFSYDNEIIVFGLSYSSTEQDIRNYFSTVGKVTSVKIIYNNAGKPRGKCFIKFEDPDAADRALDLNGTEFMGREISVERTEDRSHKYNNNNNYNNNYSNNDYNNNKVNNNNNTQPTPNSKNILKTIIVKNLNLSTSENDITNYFKYCGGIKSVKLLRDREGESKGIAFIDFINREDALKSVHLNDTELDKNYIKVELINNN